MSDKVFTTGRFVWADLMAKDVAKAKAFYSELMAWKTEEMDMGPAGKYTMLNIGERGVGGIAKLDGVPAEVPSHWINYITVENVDASTKQAKELGATVRMEPFDIPEIGRASLLQDPWGAVFFTFKSKGGEPPVKEKPEVSEFCWFEVMTTDCAKAKDFYGAMFGWTFEKAPMEGPEYWLASRDGKQTCGIMAKPDAAPACAWMSYLLVEDLEASSKRADKLGGNKMMGPQDIPGIGKFSVYIDSAGAAISLYQSAS